MIRLAGAAAACFCVPLMGSSVQGQVTNAVTGAGIAEVEISVCQPSSPGPFCARGDKRQKATTDAKGVFRIDGLDDGPYTLMAVKDGFSTDGPSKSFRVFGDTQVDIPMIPPAAISGRVTGADGTPAVGVTVKLTLFGCWTCPGLDEQVTDASGEFGFKDETAGSYGVSVTPTLRPDNKDEVRPVTTFYPSVAEREQAVAIRLQGVDLSGFNIRMQTGRAHRIRGVVMDMNGKPAPHAQVTVYKQPSGTITALRGYWAPSWPHTLAAAAPVETREDGSFEFPPLLEGEWLLRAVLEDEKSGPGTAVSGAAGVTLGRSDVDKLEIRLAAPFNISVSADWGDVPPATYPRVFPVFTAMDGQPFALSDAKPGGLPDSKVFAGRYFVWPGPGVQLPGYYLTAAMLDNRDVLGQVVDLSGPSTLKLVFKTGGGSVRGNVENCGQGIPVLLADATQVSRLGFTERCGADVWFLFRDVPPGEYTVAVLPRPVMDYSEFLAMLAAGGKRIRVDAGSVTPVDVGVAREP